MKKVVASGKTVEEAVQSALVQLGTSPEKVNITVLDQPSKGLFGIIGGKEARVEVELLPDPAMDAKLFLERVLQTMNLDATVEQSEAGGQVSLKVVGSNLGMIIGRRGQTLDSLQYLVNVVANRNHRNHSRIIVDAENYRLRRQESLENLADRLANRVIRTNKEVVLEPMNPLERKIIHSRLQNNPQVSTYSKGDEPNRKVVITLKKV